jgi:hypothetical protein
LTLPIPPLDEFGFKCVMSRRDVGGEASETNSSGSKAERSTFERRVEKDAGIARSGGKLLPKPGAVTAEATGRRGPG